MRVFLPWGCAALVLAGCGGQRHGATAVPAAAPALQTSHGAAARAPIGVARGFAVSPPETSLTPAEPQPPEPTAHYASLEAARDAIEGMLRRTVSSRDTAIHFSREAVPFEYYYVKARARGLVVQAIVNDTIECPQDHLVESMHAAGWVDDWHYSADGDDGTAIGLVCRQFLCLVEGRWDGGDPTDSTYVPRPGCKVTATVVPRRLDDHPDR